jgi:drug/metabolite transporter (DMT)-like permease
LSGGVAAAIGAAILYNLAVVVQKTQAQQVDADGLAILGALWKRPIWLLGVAIQTLGLGLHSFALTQAPVTVVQPVIAAGIAFVVIFAALVLRERPGSREIVGTLLAVLGTTALAIGVSAPPTMREVARQDLAEAVASAAALIAGLLYLASAIPGVSAGPRAVLIGGAAGVGQGMSDAMNRLAGAWLSPAHGWAPSTGIGLVAVALLVVFGVQGLVCAQNGFRQFRANTVVPCMSATQLLVPMLMAPILYGQILPEGSHSMSVWAVAVTLTLMGVLVLGSSPQVAGSLAQAPADDGS